MKYLFLALVLSLLLVGCGDSVTRHKVLSTIFDGVPSLPPVEQICEDYHQQRLSAEAVVLQTDPGTAYKSASSHRPYAEKDCRACHSNNKNVNAGLIAPKRELCGVCHADFVLGRNLHGPVAVGDCLACHLPHSSSYPSLLKAGPDEICATCHQEERLAGAMHERFVAKTISCGECHDPHSGDAHYFLK